MQTPKPVGHLFPPKEEAKTLITDLFLHGLEGVQRNMDSCPILNGYVATISGRSVTFGSPKVGWKTLTRALCVAAGIPEAAAARYICRENVPGSKLGDRVGQYDLKNGADFVLEVPEVFHRPT